MGYRGSIFRDIFFFLQEGVCKKQCLKRERVLEVKRKMVCDGSSFFYLVLLLPLEI